MDDSSVQWEALEQLQQWMRIPGSHLKELRRRLAVSLGVFVISLVLGMVGAEPVFAFLKRTGPAAALELHAFSPWDSIQVYMQVAGVVALLVTLPFLGLQLWLFARPGLTKAERRTTLFYIPFGALLLAAGILFGYLVVFRIAFFFTAGVAGNMGLKVTYGIASYFSFMCNIVVIMGLLFEMPVAAMFLTKLGILKPAHMKKVRRGAYFLLVVLGVTVTPPDFISDFLLILPLLTLYEVSIGCSGLVYRRRMRGEVRREIGRVG